MSFREKLLALEEAAGRECSVNLRVFGSKERELFVENCRCVLSCDDDFILLKIYGAALRVLGTPLRFENFGVGGVKISGNICSVEILENYDEG